MRWVITQDGDFVNLEHIVKIYKDNGKIEAQSIMSDFIELASFKDKNGKIDVHELEETFNSIDDWISDYVVGDFRE